VQRYISEEGVNLQLERSKFLDGNSHRKGFTAHRQTTRSLRSIALDGRDLFRIIPCRRR
jgi:hypothetical protein